MTLCFYGCGKEGKFQLKNGKFCCSSHYTKCSKSREKTGEKSRGRISYWKGKKTKPHTEEQCKNISRGLKGKNKYPKTEQHKEKLRKSKKGVLVNTSEKCSYGCNQKARYKFGSGKFCCSEFLSKCPEVRRKNSVGGKGKKLGPKSEDQRRKLSEVRIGKTYEELMGEKKAKETKTKLVNLSMRDKNPNWLGGISFEPYGLDFNNELKKYIREKFNYTCVLCESFAKVPHHIDYNKKNNQESNFVLLCNKCNAKVNFNRNQYEVYFKLLLENWEIKILFQNIKMVS